MPEVQKMAMSNKRVAVIGAGLAGLVAACLLSKENVDVVVYERDHNAGGRAKTVIKDGYHLNLGPHALYAACSTYKFLKENDIAVSGVPPKLGRGLAIYRKQMHNLPLSPFGLITAGYLSLGEKFEWMSLGSKMSNLDLDGLMSVSVSEWSKRNLKSERVRQTLEAFVRLSLYASSPDKVSVGQAFKQLLLAQHGVLYLNGGWQTMIDGLQKKAASKATFKFGATVESLEQKSDCIEILVDGIKEKFDAVFLCIPPDSLEKLVPGSLPQEPLVPGKIACLDVCLKSLPFPERLFAIGIDEPLYLSVHSAAAQLAPAGGALIHVGHYLNEESKNQNCEERMMQLLDQIQPGWRDLLVYKRYLPHMTSTNGLPLATLGGANGLPAPNISKTGKPNIFVCGDYVGLEGELADCSTSSALKAVEMFLNN